MIKSIFKSLGKTRQKVARSIRSIIPLSKKISRDDIEKLEEVLISADVGVETTMEIIEDLKSKLSKSELTGSDVLVLLESHLMEILGEESGIDVNNKPFVILIAGVNGSGKTTTVAKLAHYFKCRGKKIVLAAGDTFRAAAQDQLEIWAKRAGVDIVNSDSGADPASVIYDASQKAMLKNFDIMIADTAGRLHTKKNLMEELRKVHRVASKAIEGSPHEVILVVDATTGQNGLMQAEIFGQTIPLTGIILAKLDSTAKGGIAVAIRRKLGIPIKFIGVGEKIDDLAPFVPKDYVKAMLEIDSE